MYRFPNPRRNPWLIKYNQLIDDIESNKLLFSFVPIDRCSFSGTNEEYRVANLKAGKLTIHHIIPKTIKPALAGDKKNLLMLPFKEHMDLHYYLWKSDKMYAPHLRFGAVYGRKYGLWDFPGGDDEYKLFLEDCRSCRKNVKKSVQYHRERKTKTTDKQTNLTKE